MRTVLAYVLSVLFHAAVLVPLAHLPTAYDGRPTYSVSGRRQAVVLEASLSTGEDRTMREVQVTVELRPPTVQATSETVLPPTALQPAAAMTPTPPVPLVREMPKSRLPTPSVVNEANRESPAPTKAIAVQWEGVRQWCQLVASRVGATISAARATVPTDGGEIDQPPRAAPSNPAPPYPSDALTQGVEGVVLLRLCIRADGTVAEASIHRSSGTPSLDDSALRTVREGWRFLPATRRGQAVSYEAILPIRFTIRK